MSPQRSYLQEMIRKSIWAERPRVFRHEPCGDGLLDRLLASRDIGRSDPGSFFSSSVNLLPGALGMFGGAAGRAAQAILSSLAAGDPIGIIGDYDADGVMSAAILNMVMRDLRPASGPKSTIRTFLPSRQREGYGLNPKTLQSYIDMWETNGIQKPSLTVVADCGTSSNEQVVALKLWGCPKVVVIDHHIPDPKNLSSDADVLLNWRMSGEDNMCAAGECFHVARAMCEMSRRGWDKYTAFAAVGTVGDMVPVEGINRVLVKAGILDSWQCGSFGLALLGGDKFTGGLFQKDIAFGLTPKINSIGRLDDPDIALELMLTKDFSRAKEIASLMKDVDAKRKSVQRVMEAEAMEMAEKSGLENGLLLYSDKWLHGVCGIASNAVVEEFRCPVILMGEHNGEIKGSGRSLGTTSIKDIMDSVSHLFSRYGGHELACGANLRREFLESAPREFDRACGEYYARHGRPSSDLVYDLELEPELIVPGTGAKILETLHPYCDASNPEPTFRVSSMRVTGLVEKDAPEGEGKDWKLTVVRGCKGGFDIPVGFKSWDGRRRGDWMGKDVDILFRFPQSVNEKDVQFVEIIDIMEHKEV